MQKRPSSLSFLLFALTIMATLSVIGCTFQHNESETEKTKENTSSNVSDTDKDEYADWKTYRNEKYGFEIKYPDALTLSKTNDVDTVQSFILNYDPNQVKPSCIGIVYMPLNDDLKDYSFGEYVRRDKVMSSEYNIDSLEKIVTDNNIEGYKIIWTNKSDKGRQYITYFESNKELPDNYGKIHKLRAIEISSNEECKDIYDKMIRIFNLIE